MPFEDGLARHHRLVSRQRGLDRAREIGRISKLLRAQLRQPRHVTCSRPPLREDFELRLLEEHHAFELFAAVERNRGHLRQWLPWVDATRTEDDGIAFIRSTLEMFAAHDGFTAGIWHRERVAGVIGTHRIDWRNRRVELGYWLAREFEGRGIITDACRVAISHLFREWI